MSLSDKIWERIGEDGFRQPKHIEVKDVIEFIKKLKERGLKKTLYPKYLMLTIEDLKELAGEELK